MNRLIKLRRVFLVIVVLILPTIVRAGDEFSDLAPFAQPQDPSRNAGRPGTGQLKICKMSGYENEPSTNRVLHFPKNLLFEDVGTLDDANAKWWALDVELLEPVQMNPPEQCVIVKARVVLLATKYDQPGLPRVTNFTVSDRRTLAVGGIVSGKTIEQAPPETMEAYVHAYAATDFK